MKKKLLLLGLLLHNSLALSFECGEYKIRGIARMINNSPVLVVNEHSASEYYLKIPISEEPRIAPYIDRPFILSALIDKSMNGTKGEARNIKDVSLRVANPLNEKADTGLKLIKETACLK